MMSPLNNKENLLFYQFLQFGWEERQVDPILDPLLLGPWQWSWLSLKAYLFLSFIKGNYKLNEKFFDQMNYF